MTDLKEQVSTQYLPDQFLNTKELLAVSMVRKGSSYELIGDALGVVRQRAYMLLRELRERGLDVPHPRGIRQEARRKAAEERAAAKVVRRERRSPIISALLDK